MSGRKRGEVLGVLRGTEQLKQDRFDAVFERCETLLQNFAPPRDDRQSVVLPAVIPEVRDYFAARRSTIESEFSEQQSSLGQDSAAPDPQAVRAQLRQVRKKLEQLNGGCSALQNEMGRKEGSDYFTDEYNRARQLQDQYMQLLEQKMHPLRDSLEAAHQAFAKRRAEFKACRQRLTALQEEAEGLNELARQRKTDDDLKAARKLVEKTWSQLDRDAAGKFWGEELRSLSQQCEALLADPDLLLQQVDSFVAQCSSLQQKAAASLAVFEAQGEEASVALAALDARLDQSYRNPFSPKSFLSLADFERELFHETVCQERLAGLVAPLRKCFAAEDYASFLEGCQDVQDEVDALLSEFADRVEREQQKVTTALGICKVLKGFGYAVETEIDEQGGIRILSRGNHPVEFRVGAGKSECQEAAAGLEVTFNIDNLGSSCKASADSIAQELRRNGIAFRVTDYGRPAAADPERPGGGQSSRI